VVRLTYFVPDSLKFLRWISASNTY
jgi:hypothetical protein